MENKELVEQTEWSKKSKQNVSSKILKELILKQNGKCALTNVNLIFNKKLGTPEKGKGCHPLYAAIDHKSPKDKNNKKLGINDVQLVCYAINDMKGHLPSRLFEVILYSKVWNEFVLGWQKLAEKKSENSEYNEYIKNFDLEN